MKIGFRKLGVQRSREILSFVLGFLAIFFLRKHKAKYKKYSDFRGRKTSFDMNNQEVQRTRIPLIQY